MSLRTGERNGIYFNKIEESKFYEGSYYISARTKHSVINGHFTKKEVKELFDINPDEQT